MGVAVKICGLRTPEGIAAAVEGGARFVGFVFYGRSPRSVSPAEVRGLARRVPEGVAKVGVFVDPGDPELEAARACLDMIQLHGAETPERVAMIRARFARPVIKALKLATEADLAPVAVGMVSYHSGNIQKIMGAKSAEIESILGFKHDDEVIHRNNLVLTAHLDEGDEACRLKI